MATPTVAPTQARGNSAQHALRDTVLAGLDTLDQRLAALVRPLSREQLAKRPPGGGWSVGEVLEHICLANEQYLTPMRALVEDPKAPRLSDGAWRRTIMGGLLIRGLEGKMKTRTVKAITPGPVPRPDALAAIRATHDEVRALVRRAEGLEWRRMRMASPFARIVRPNFGEACLVILRHGERHAGQIERAIRAITGAGVAR